jgi:DNA helicase-2/ATP-dependent DNA helicase PcrA
LLPTTIETASSLSEVILSATWETYHRPPLEASEKALLLPLVENYQLSVTHLNDFLDITRGGPQSVLEQHLLRFPQPSTLAQSYGTAVHRSLQEFFQQYKYDAVLPGQDFLLQAFQRALTHERLAEADFTQLWQRGQNELALYYESQSSNFGLQDIVERNFSSQQVMVGSAHLTGKIDRIVEVEKGMASVHDIKTGKPSASWTGGDAYQKLKLDKYRRQLLFYKLLVEHSRDYGHLQVISGVLEFIEDLDGRFIELSLPLGDIHTDELERLKQLINAVYTHIQQLNFPDISGYSQDLSGIRKFEDDLLGGKV